MAAASAFSATLTHKFGSTTITAEPKRIVTVGLTDQDAVLALGRVPGRHHRVDRRLHGRDRPVGGGQARLRPVPRCSKDTGTRTAGGEDRRAAPDLILALYSGLTKEQYETLSKSRRSVAQPKEYNDYGIPWEAQTETVGQAARQGAEGRQARRGRRGPVPTAADGAPRVRRQDRR